jgi:hypothetical protein
LYNFGIYVNYTLLYYTTDIAELATREFSFEVVRERLNATLAVGNFTTVLNAIAVFYNITHLTKAQTDLAGLVIASTFSSGFVHSAFPSSIPTNQPSTLPSSQPSTMPTAVPTFTIRTQWEHRVTFELESRFKLTERYLRGLYFELTIQNISYYGGPHTWTNFVDNMFRPMMQAKEFVSLTFLLANSTH